MRGAGKAFLRYSDGMYGTLTSLTGLTRSGGVYWQEEFLNTVNTDRGQDTVIRMGQV
jgi:hypothetical protein